MVDTLGASPSGVHYSAVAFNSEPRIIFRFNTLEGPQYTVSNVKRRIDEMRYTQDTTRVDKALDIANNVLFTPKSGARKDVPQVSNSDKKNICINLFDKLNSFSMIAWMADA